MLFFSRPGHKILSKYEVQGEVAIFIFKTRTKYFAAKKKLKKKIFSFKKVQARILCDIKQNKNKAI